MQTLWLVEKRKPQEIVAGILTQAREPNVETYWKCTDVQASGIQMLFRLYLLERLSFWWVIEQFELDKLGMPKTLHLLTLKEVFCE